MIPIRERAVLVIGQTGRGKSSFINHLTGSQLETSDSDTSCTAKVTSVYWNGIQVIDTPGTGDIREGQRPITNEDIFTMILKETQKVDIVCVVMMIGLEELETRGQNNSVGLVDMLMNRFRNLGALIEFGFKDEYGWVTQPLLISKYQQNRAKFSKLCISLGNVHICGKLDFSLLKNAVLKATSRTNPIILDSKSYILRCSVCHHEADPLLVDQPCRNHGNPGVCVHGQDTQIYHPKEKVNYHSGSTHKPHCKNTQYECCGRDIMEQGCKLGFECCRSDSPGCETKCTSCFNNVKSPGCKTTCDLCKQVTSTIGCITIPDHVWECKK